MRAWLQIRSRILFQNSREFSYHHKNSLVLSKLDCTHMVLGLYRIHWLNWSSKSMLRRGQLLHEAVDDCIGSEEYPRLESASFVVMPIQTLEARGPFYFPYIYVSPKPVLWVTKPNTLQPQLSKFSFPKLHPSSTPKCVSPNLFFWHSVQSLVFQLHQPTTE